MAGSTAHSWWEDIGHATAVGLAFAPFALVFTIWIPSFALLFGVIAVTAGAIDVRWASGRRARWGLLPIGLGILGILATLLVVAVTSTGPTSGSANTVVVPP
jgi:hypothetical protein